MDLLEDMFDHRSDHEWVNEIDTEKWALLFDQLNFKREKYDFVADSFYEPVTTSMLIIGNRIASLGMQPQIITRLPHFEQYNSPFLAAKNGHTATVKFLLRHGADPTLADAEGKNALKYAEEANHKEIIEILKKVTPKK